MELRPVSFGCGEQVHAAYSVKQIERWRECPKHVAYTVCGQDNLVGGPVWDRLGSDVTCPVCGAAIPVKRPTLPEFLGMDDSPNMEIAA